MLGNPIILSKNVAQIMSTGCIRESGSRGRKNQKFLNRICIRIISLKPGSVHTYSVFDEKKYLKNWVFVIQYHSSKTLEKQIKSSLHEKSSAERDSSSCKKQLQIIIAS